MKTLVSNNLVAMEAIHGRNPLQGRHIRGIVGPAALHARAAAHPGFRMIRAGRVRLGAWFAGRGGRGARAGHHDGVQQGPRQGGRDSSKPAHTPIITTHPLKTLGRRRRPPPDPRSQGRREAFLRVPSCKRIFPSRFFSSFLATPVFPLFSSFARLHSSLFLCPLLSFLFSSFTLFFLLLSLSSPPLPSLPPPLRPAGINVPDREFAEALFPGRLRQPSHSFCFSVRLLSLLFPSDFYFPSLLSFYVWFPSATQ